MTSSLRQILQGPRFLFFSFSLVPAEWAYVQQMCDFSEPLNAATERLCQSRFPTMEQVMPLYIAVIQELKLSSLFLSSPLTRSTFSNKNIEFDYSGCSETQSQSIGSGVKENDHKA